MERFKLHQKVRIVRVDDCPLHACLLGKTGTVVRIKMSNPSAWIQMDEDIPARLRRFPGNDSRANHVCFYPDECETIHD